MADDPRPPGLLRHYQEDAQRAPKKSLREGFGLTVAEALWKGTPVIGGKVGGIRYQVEDGVNGFLVSSIEEAAARIVQVIKDTDLRGSSPFFRVKSSQQTRHSGGVGIQALGLRHSRLLRPT
jgi:glycosyltransferase involved in cell wall biosynthesis